VRKKRVKRERDKKEGKLIDKETKRRREKETDRQKYG
jgi:hypothetical protein